MNDLKEKFALKLDKLKNKLIDDRLFLIITYCNCEKAEGAKKAYTLRKDFKVKSVEKLNIPKNIETNNDINYKKILDKKFSEDILLFVDIMLKNFKKQDLKCLKNNINELNIDVLDIEVLGLYDVFNNIILLKKDSIYSSIFHELMHLSSSYIKNDTVYCGFSQKCYDLDNLINIGKGLNEGYTQYLTERYFNDQKIPHSYALHRYFAEKLEYIIGKEKMQKLYLNANLLGLIHEMTKYTNISEVEQFISSLDFLIEHPPESNMNKYQREFMNEIIKKVSLFLIKCYIVRLKRALDKKIIDYDTFIKYINCYINDTIIYIDYRNCKDIVYNKKDIIKVLKEINLLDLKQYINDENNQFTLTLKK